MSYESDTLKALRTYVPGTVFYKLIGIGNPYKCHVVAHVEGMIVFKWYGRHKQWWHYHIEHPFSVLSQAELGEERR